MNPISESTITALRPSSSLANKGNSCSNVKQQQLCILSNCGGAPLRSPRRAGARPCPYPRLLRGYTTFYLSKPLSFAHFTHDEMLYEISHKVSLSKSDLSLIVSISIKHDVLSNRSYAKSDECFLSLCNLDMQPQQSALSKCRKQ